MNFTLTNTGRPISPALSNASEETLIPELEEQGEITENENVNISKILLTSNVGRSDTYLVLVRCMARF